jgi:ATP-dependent Clp protease ATP-binding subunit ClpA
MESEWREVLATLLEAEERNVAVELPGIPYTEQALRVLELSKEEARTFNHDYVGTEHLLLGILREGSGAAELITQGVTFESMRGGIMFILGGRPQGTPSSLLTKKGVLPKAVLITLHSPLIPYRRLALPSHRSGLQP